MTKQKSIIQAQKDYTETEIKELEKTIFNLTNLKEDVKPNTEAKKHLEIFIQELNKTKNENSIILNEQELSLGVL